jgi:hypothetical protein
MDRDRYRLSEFAGLRNKFSLPSDIEQRQLGSLLRRSELTYASSKGIDHPQLLAMPLQIHLANSTSANVGRTLLDLEVELRRTAAYMENGAIRPSRNNEIVEMISARHVASVDLVVAAAMEIYSLLTSRPIDFLLLLDWFWTHRHNHTKARSPYEHIDPTRIWGELVAMAQSCIESGGPVVVTMTIEVDGSTKFGFRSL